MSNGAFMKNIVLLKMDKDKILYLPKRYQYRKFGLCSSIVYIENNKQYYEGRQALSGDAAGGNLIRYT